MSGLAKVYSGAVYGVDAYEVEIEVNVGNGDPRFVVVGLPDAAVKESTDRVWTALANSGFCPPLGRVTVNLAPADIKKEGPSFDLPIALGALVADRQLETNRLARYAVVGELALGGEVRRVRGVLPIALRARAEGRQGILVPPENAEEAAVVSGIDTIPVASLAQAARFLSGDEDIPPFVVDAQAAFAGGTAYAVDYADVRGQESARRALEVAVAGGHNILLVGPPGTGKSMLAKRVPTILPPLTLEEALETTKIHSIAGVLPPHQAVVSSRPFRAPHHTISDAGLLGGGTHPMPGEVSLAHNGVLFLDELPEFHRNVLEVMRQPLEDGVVTISRASGTVSFPCRFMLVAAMNPCPCGHFGDPRKECRCTPMQMQRYRNRISGPLLDRIDIHVEVPAVEYQQLASVEKGESSAAIRDRVQAARAIQRERFTAAPADPAAPNAAPAPAVHCNALMTSRDVREHCVLGPSAQLLLKTAMAEYHLSARAYDRILKVARTIADMAASPDILEDHIAEAVQYRALDRQYWE
ncbi:MAG: YifB family Mg chelatase-like AAA ATPase [Kiritimatiellae bacterium]|nr:YifB family Mg chelatase-like AAA ATPase [Kiritimatiellia bacterium]